MTHESLTYIVERWRAVAVGIPPEQLNMAWEIYAGGVAVGTRAALTAGNSDVLKAIVALCAGEPPKV